MCSELVSYKRILKLDLPHKQSAFLWGARKTGKSTYLKTNFPNSTRYDLLLSDLYLRYNKEPSRFREEVLALPAETLKHPIIVDEVQKIPLLLDEIHWLIENTDARFILCGSSARKLKNSAVNLLGGRAWKYNFYPLVSSEIPNFDLLKALNTGLIPSHYLSTNPNKSLKAYIQDYLVHEIQAEGLTRNLPAFARFLDVLVFSNGELTNFSNIARDTAIDSKTVKSYYDILVDTLLGYFVAPYEKKVKRDIISKTSKFYLFDVGVSSHLAKINIEALAGTEAGKAFEHFILMELIAYRGLKDLDFEIKFWRTKTGLEVDFILGKGEVAIEVKINQRVDKTDFRGLLAFAEEHQPKKCYVVCLEKAPRKILLNNPNSPIPSEILVLPYQNFLNMLWRGEII
ncbi:MAG: DUF4143 domain-containing protein [Gammaproteobacteria bacterium]